MKKRRPGPRRPPPPGYRADVVEVLDRLFARQPKVTRGSMFGFPAFYTGGKLFACVYGDGVGLKLPQAMVQDLEGKPGFTPFQPYGMAKRKEWVSVQRDRAARYADDLDLFLAAIRFVVRTAARRKNSGSVGRLRKRP